MRMQTKSSRLLNEGEEKSEKKQINDRIDQCEIENSSIELSETSPLINITNLFNNNCNYASTPIKNKSDTHITSRPVSPLCNDDSPLIRSPVTPKCNNVCKISSPVTPKCNGSACGASISSPMTPSYNMKLLTNVASNLNYVNKESDLMQEDSLLSELSFSTVDASTCEGEPLAKRSRKEKSINFICEKFIKRFPEYVENDKGIPISITQIAAKIGVEKRRIYDIVNILESVSLVKKIKKDLCEWHGKSRLLPALLHLKSIAVKSGVSNFIKNATEKYMHNELQDFAKDFAQLKTTLQSSLPSKPKSLTSVTKQFLSLFLAENEPFPLPLDIAAFIIVGDTADSLTPEWHKKGTEFKTKVRRLYDIANVLATLNILKRSDKIRGKPTFQYIGPNLNNLNLTDISMDVGDFDGSTRETCFKNLKVLPINKHISSPNTCFSRTKSENWDNSSPNFKKTTSFIRHSSLQEICDIASAEHSKLDSPTFLNENSSTDTFFFRTKSENWDKPNQKHKRTRSFIRHSSLQEICAVASAERSKLNSPNFLNENSNDSCMSFFSFSSVDTNSVENLCDFSVKEKETFVSSDSKPTSPVKCSQSNSHEEASKEINKMLTDNEILNLKQEKDLKEFHKGQKIMKLSSNQQKLVLESLNLSFDKTQVSLLLTPEGKKQNSTEQMENNQQLLQNTPNFKVLLQAPQNPGTEIKGGEKQPMTVKEFNIFKNISNTMTTRSIVSPKCNKTNFTSDNVSENDCNLLVKSDAAKNNKCMSFQPLTLKSNLNANSHSSNSDTKNQKQMNGVLGKDKRFFKAIPINLFPNNSSSKSNVNFAPVKFNHPTVVKINNISTSTQDTIFNVIPCFPQENASVLKVVPVRPNCQSIPIKLIYKTNVQKK